MSTVAVAVADPAEAPRALADIDAYHARQAPAPRAICDALRAEIANALPDAEAKVWHGAPVFFLAGNPVVGYAVRAPQRGVTPVQLLFWSGQSFDEPDLAAEGKFKAAQRSYCAAAEVDAAALGRWLAKARAIQWDYQNIVRRRGVLLRREG